VVNETLLGIPESATAPNESCDGEDLLESMVAESTPTSEPINCTELDLNVVDEDIDFARPKKGVK